MVTLARGQVSSVSNPVLDAHMVVAGVLTDVYSLEYVIAELVTSRFTPTQVYPESGRQAVDLEADRVSKGRYAANWEVPAAEEEDEGALVGEYRITWYFKVDEDSPEQSFIRRFEVIESMYEPGRAYATVQNLRDEGLAASATYTDAYLFRRLVEASAAFEQYTGRVFCPVAKTIYVDGTGQPALLLDEPIIGIGDVSTLSSLLSPDATLLEPEDMRVYNRHLTQGLMEPDDRENPRLEWFSSEYQQTFGYWQRSPHPSNRIWPAGRQNIIIEGVFGYTDPDGSPTGGVPRGVTRAVQMLALMDMPKLTDVDRREDAAGRWQVVTERTRDQSISRFSGVDAAARAAVIGSVTGNPALDRLIIQYKRPLKIGSA